MNSTTPFAPTLLLPVRCCRNLELKNEGENWTTIA